MGHNEKKCAKGSEEKTEVGKEECRSLEGVSLQTFSSCFFGLALVYKCIMCSSVVVVMNQSIYYSWCVRDLMIT